MSENKKRDSLDGLMHCLNVSKIDTETKEMLKAFREKRNNKQQQKNEEKNQGENN